MGGLFAFFVGGKVPYFLFYTILLYLILPLFHVLSGLLFIKGHVSLQEGEFYAGDIVNIKYQIENKSLIPYPNLTFIPKLSKELGTRFFPSQYFYLNKKDKWSQTISTNLNRRGQYMVGAFRIEISDVFHLYTFSKEIHSNIDLVVYPKIIPLNNLSLPARVHLGELKVSLQATPDRSLIKNLRGYLDGDSSRLIHWKATSKNTIPIVKEFENTSDLRLEIFLDNEKVGFKNDLGRHLEDKMVEVTLSLANFFLLNGIGLSISHEKDKTVHTIEGRTYRDLKAFLKNLAIFLANGHLEFSNVVSFRREFLERGRNSILITPRIDNKIASLSLDLLYRACEVVLIIILKDDFKLNNLQKSLIQNLRDEGILVLLVTPCLNMDRVFGG